MNQEALDLLNITDPDILDNRFFTAQTNTTSWSVPMNFGVLLANGDEKVACYTPQDYLVQEVSFQSNQQRDELQTTGIHDCAGFLIESDFFVLLIHAYGAKALTGLLTFFDSELKKIEPQKYNKSQTIFTNPEYIHKLPSYFLALAMTHGFRSVIKTNHRFVTPSTVITANSKT